MKIWVVFTYSKKTMLYSLLLFMLCSLNVASFSSETGTLPSMEKPHFRWIGLIHYDGNSLAINSPISNLNQAIVIAAYVDIRFVYEETGKAIKND